MLGSAMGKLRSVVVYLVFLALFVEVALQAFYYFTAGDFLFARVGVPVWSPDPHSGIANRRDMHRLAATRGWAGRWPRDGRGA